MAYALLIFGLKRRHPLLHERSSFLEQIAEGAHALNLIPDRYDQGRLHQGVRCVRLFGCTVTGAFMLVLNTLERDEGLVLFDNATGNVVLEA